MTELQITYKLYFLFKKSLISQKEATALSHILKIGSKKLIEANSSYKELINQVDEMADWSGLISQTTFKTLLQITTNTNPEFKIDESSISNLDLDFHKLPILAKLVTLIITKYFTTAEGVRLLMLAQLMPSWQKEVTNYEQIEKFSHKLYTMRSGPELSRPTLQSIFEQAQANIELKPVEKKIESNEKGWEWANYKDILKVELSQDSQDEKKEPVENLVVILGDNWQFEKTVEISKLGANIPEFEKIYISAKKDSKLLLSYTKSKVKKGTVYFTRFCYTDENYIQHDNYYSVNEILTVRPFGQFTTAYNVGYIEEILFNTNQTRAVWDEFFTYHNNLLATKSEKPFTFNIVELLSFLSHHQLIDYKYIESIVDIRTSSLGNLSAVLFTENSFENLHKKFFNFRRNSLNDNFTSLRYIRDRIKPHLNYTDNFEEQVLDTYDQSAYNKKTATGDKIRGVLKDILSINWSLESKANDIKNAKTILDEEFYGQEHLKQMIIEYITLNNHTTNSFNKHLLFVGNAGVGKTMIARAIARIMGRCSYLISLSSKSQLSLITGTDISFIGSSMGELAKSIQLTKSNNPLIILDEVDKASNSSIVNSLYQILDKTQGKEFYDLYLRLSLNLDKFMFILTANKIDKIPDPILNRCHVIELKDYDKLEKVEIIIQHVFPKLITSLNLKKLSISIDREFVELLIDQCGLQNSIRFFENKLTNIISSLIYEYEQKGETENNQLTLDGSKKYLISPL
jgi:DNA replication protein DnaC